MFPSWRKSGFVELFTMSGYVIKRTSMIKLAYYPALFFSGMALSLGRQIGVAGIGLNELLLVFSILLLILIAPAGVFAYRKFYANHQTTALAIFCLACFSAAGYFVGMLFAPDINSLFQFLRLLLFSLLVLALPYVALISRVSNPERDLVILTLGVVVSLVGNWAIFLYGSHIDPSLPGQNMIGQQVALFMPFLFYLMIKNKVLWKRLFIFIMVLLFLITSIFSLSKGSWLAILGGFLFFTLFTGRRGFYWGIGVAILMIPFAVTYHEELIHIFNVEMSASAGSQSNSQRIATILSGFYIAADHPFGVGAAYEYVAANYLSVTGMHWIQSYCQIWCLKIFKRRPFVGLTA